MPLDAMSDESDEALLMQYAAGDQGAARALTLRLTPRIYAHACRMLGVAAEAEDVTQEALLRLWRIAPDWRRGEAQITTWLYRVVANLCTDRLRRARGVALDAVPEPEDETASALERLQQQDRTVALQAALNRLPDRQRQAVILRHIEGLANPEIAEIMEISTEAVESLTARGKWALSADLSDRREELGYQND
ncbi:RNA polymerase sigma factor [uncultured Roseovarius sp.]|uniref:RNA polymerase sigma factor n=1 Tax=uncultured Roseovarius sp. TaxID=293344 RepID=UPI0026084FE1|nr:RNA polymerase sigma factor [uncultured Roseovarius sp.]